MAWNQVETIEQDGRFDAYVAQPDGPARGAIVVIQEIFGVNEGIRRKCDHWASLGYLAIAPDLFWRLEPRVELDPDVEPQFKQALDLMGRFDQDQGVRDLEAAIRAARELLPEGRKVGCVGYCLGGRLAYMVAARTDVNASVGYYGVGLNNLLHERHAIAHPLMLHVAVEDHFVPKEVQQAVRDGLADVPRVVIHDYPGMDHGFAAEMGNRRNDEAARLADSRTEAFFAEHLD